MFAVSIQGGIHVISHLPGPLSNHVLLSNKFTPEVREENEQENPINKRAGRKGMREQRAMKK